MLTKRKPIKICFLGDYKIGKRTYIAYLKNKKFVDFKKRRVSWGAPYAFVKMSINEETYKVHIFYQTSFLMKIFLNKQADYVIKSFFQKADGILLMYNITNRTSFEQIKLYLVRTIEVIKSKSLSSGFFKNIAEQLPFKFVLVGNKCDLDKERKVSEEGGQRLAKDIGNIPFYEVSCVTGANVFKSFENLIINCTT
ncbi:MAG: hypothetical protein ACTSRG_06905 [Candidatus Helarchaeota archaeon]